MWTKIYTGITLKDIQNKPTINDVKKDILEFIGEDVLVGFRTSKAIKLLETNVKNNLSNKYVDVQAIAKKVVPELENYAFLTLVNYLGVYDGDIECRAMPYAHAIKEIYDSVKAIMAEKNLTLDDLFRALPGQGKGKSKNKPNFAQIQPQGDVEEHKDSYLYGKRIILTGKLAKMKRAIAVQKIVDSGANYAETITKNTREFTILVEGTVNKSHIKGDKSNKQEEAKKFNIPIISEMKFYSLLEEEDML